MKAAKECVLEPEDGDLGETSAHRLQTRAACADGRFDGRKVLLTADVWSDWSC